MNRRSTLALFVGLIGSATVLLEGNRMALAESDADKLKATHEAFHNAISSLDMSKMEALWAHDADATLINPRDKSISVGWDAIKKDWEATFNANSELKVTSTDAHVHVSGNVAWVTGLAGVVGKLKTGAELNAPTFEQTAFEKRGDQWLIVAHGAWRVPQ